MTYTVATVIAYNGERGVAYDNYDNPIYFVKENIHPEDRESLQEGSRIVYNSISSIELATSAFTRFIGELGDIP